jgi:hypothetical protein
VGLSRLKIAAGSKGRVSAPLARSTPLDVVHPACFEVYRQPFEQSVVTVAPTSSYALEAPRNGFARYATRAYWRNRVAKLRRSIKKRL